MMTHENYKKKIVDEALLWLRKYVNFYDQDRGAVQRICVKHLNAQDQVTSDICSETLPPYTSEKDIPSAQDMERCLDSSINEAIIDARNRGSLPQKYAFVAEFERSPERPATRVIRIRGGERMDGDELGHLEDSEPATAKGFLAQTMRHLEVVMKQASYNEMTSMRILQEQNVALASQNSDLIARHMETIKIYEGMMDGKKKRELEERKAEAWTKNVDSFADMLRILLPHAVNKMAGKSLMPVQHTPEEMEMVALLGSLRSEQLDMMRRIMTPDQLIALVTIIEKVQKKHANDAALVPSSGDQSSGNGSGGGQNPS